MRPAAFPLRGVTVPQVLKEAGYELEPRLTWAVGQAMQAWFFKTFGAQPPKDNRPKTYDKGVHCFAIYPDESVMRAKILEIAGAMNAEAARQWTLDL